MFLGFYRFTVLLASRHRSSYQAVVAVRARPFADTGPTAFAKLMQWQHRSDSNQCKPFFAAGHRCHMNHSALIGGL